MLLGSWFRRLAVAMRLSTAAVVAAFVVGPASAAKLSQPVPAAAVEAGAQIVQAGGALTHAHPSLCRRPGHPTRTEPFTFNRRRWTYPGFNRPSTAIGTRPTEAPTCGSLSYQPRRAWAKMPVRMRVAAS